MKVLIRITLVGVTALVMVSVLLAALGGSTYPATTATTLLTPTPTYCPVTTPEPFWVDPVTSPTALLSQDIRVYLGNCEAVTVTAESGTFSSIGPCYFDPALVHVALLPNATHHLEVSGKVRRVQHNGCVYGGYTLRTTRDRFGAPLVITQHFTVASTIYLPLVMMEDLSATCWRAR